VVVVCGTSGTTGTIVVLVVAFGVVVTDVVLVVVDVLVVVRGASEVDVATTWTGSSSFGVSPVNAVPATTPTAAIPAIPAAHGHLRRFFVAGWTGLTGLVWSVHCVPSQ